MSNGSGTVDALDRSDNALVTAFAGGVNAFLRGGGVCGGEYGTVMREFEVLLVVTKSLAGVALGVWVDREVCFKTPCRVEDNEAADANC